MTSSVEVAVVVLNWRQAETTAKCLQSLQSLTYPCFKIILVDNHSQDGSVERLSVRFPSLTILETERNLGFAGGMNVGIRHALAHHADWIFLLNNDTTVASDVIDALLDASSRDGQIGVVIPYVFYAHEPQRRWSIGSRRAPLTLATRDFGVGRVDSIDEEEPHPVDYAIGCAMLVRSEVFRDVGLLDERYFMYYEDLDFSLRVQRAGYSIWANPKAHVWHAVSTSTAEDIPLRKYHLARSSVRFFRDYTTNRIHAGFLLLYRLLVAIKVLGRLGWRGRWAEAGAYVQGLWDGLRQERG